MQKMKQNVHLQLTRPTLQMEQGILDTQKNGDINVQILGVTEQIRLPSSLQNFKVASNLMTRAAWQEIAQNISILLKNPTGALNSTKTETNQDPPPLHWRKFTMNLDVP